MSGLNKEALITLLKKKGLTEEEALIEFENRKKIIETKLIEKEEENFKTYQKNFIKEYNKVQTDLKIIDYTTNEKVKLDENDKLNKKVKIIFKHSQFALHNERFKVFLYEQLRDIDLNGVTNMTNLFNFNTYDVGIPGHELYFQCIEKDIYNYILKGVETWNVSQVSNMSKMFLNFYETIEDPFTGNKSIVDGFAGRMNLNFTNWSNQLENVVNMEAMFANCYMFLGEGLDLWNTIDNVRNIDFMFQRCALFNKNLSSWGNLLGNVVTMKGTFKTCNEYEGHGLENWTTINNVRDISAMFSECPKFNANLSTWGNNLTSVVNMSYLLHQSTQYEGIGMDNWLSENVKFPNLHYCQFTFYETLFQTNNIDNVCSDLIRKLKSSPNYKKSFGVRYEVSIFGNMTDDRFDNNISPDFLLEQDGSELITNELITEPEGIIAKTKKGKKKTKQNKTIKNKSEEKMIFEEEPPTEESEMKTIELITEPKVITKTKKGKNKNVKTKPKEEIVWNTDDEEEELEKKEEPLKKKEEPLEKKEEPLKKKEEPLEKKEEPLKKKEEPLKKKEEPLKKKEEPLKKKEEPVYEEKEEEEEELRVYNRPYHSADKCGENFESLSRDIEQLIAEHNIDIAINRVDACITARKKEKDISHQQAPIRRLKALRAKLENYKNIYSTMYDVDSYPVQVIYEKIQSEEDHEKSGHRFRVIIHNIKKFPKGKDVEIVMPTKVTIIKGGNSRRRSRRNTKKINKRTKGTKHRNRKIKNRNIKNRTKKYKK